MKKLSFLLAFAIVILAACGGRNAGPVTPFATLPLSISPALTKPAPMAKTAVLPSSAMQSPRSLKSDIQSLSWTQIPGSATQVSASPDGSIWVLSTQPTGPDKYIWHYAGGAWTNISGLASQLAIAPGGTLYAINSGGGTYSYSAGSWTALGGGASALTAAADGSTYVLSNGGSGPDRPIWHNVSGVWSQVPGAGTALNASWDTGNYTAPGGTVNSGGLYILNSAGSIYYENSGGTFATLPGNASSISATTVGGVFALGYPANAGGNTIYYYNLSNGTWTAQPGAGVSISTDGAHLYVVGASGAIYSSPVSPVQVLPHVATVLGAPAYVNTNNFTLYEFSADAANVSNCTPLTYGACSTTWPPLIAPAGAIASGDFAPFTRSDGKQQWSYLGHPLYTFSGDGAAYGSNGNGITESDGSSWSIARPAGTSTPTPDPSPTTRCVGYYC